MMDISAFTSLLLTAVEKSGERPTAIREFQKLVRQSDEIIGTQATDEILHDLAYDLEFYEPDDAWRKQDAAFFSDGRAKELIRSALTKLGKAGFAIGHSQR
jgi:hypothetical protein